MGECVLESVSKLFITRDLGTDPWILSSSLYTIFQLL